MPASARQARRWIAEALRASGVTVEIDTVVLLVNELVSNVVLHARTACELSYHVTRRRLRVEVRDGSNAMPDRTPPTDVPAMSGRGLLLIDTLSSSHGAEALPGGGKLVWFELDAVAQPVA